VRSATCFLVTRHEKSQVTDLDGVIAREMQGDVLQEASMASTENKAISVEPIRVFGVIFHGVAP
jgi:hypothetical protein